MRLIGLITLFSTFFIFSYLRSRHKKKVQAQSPWTAGSLTEALRIFFPSWRFFDEIKPVPRIEFRIRHKSKTTNSLPPSSTIHSPRRPASISWGPWQSQNFPQQNRSLWNLFHNPRENLRLSFSSQVENLLSEISIRDGWTEEEIKNLIPYKMIAMELRSEILRTESVYGLIDFQFRIKVFEQNEAADGSKDRGHWSDVLYSHEMEL